ncbi:MAG TPA: thioesterase family protein [Dehalococcoidia bacterium]|nr:thioesterase family protein [Dehalococcoidia bacterium]
MSYRFSALYQTRHTDTFGGTEFVHMGVLFALTELALVDYDGAIGVAAEGGVLRFNLRSEARFLSPLRWREGARVQMRCSRLRGSRISFECLVSSATSGKPVAEIVHDYAYVDPATGRSQAPSNLDAIRAAILAYEAPDSVEE